MAIKLQSLTSHCTVTVLYLLALVALCGSVKPADSRFLRFFGNPTVAPDVLLEMQMNVSSMLRFRGYGSEEHSVVTNDGYILTIYRVLPRNRSVSNSGKPAVFLQHGLLDSSFTWISNFPSQSLAFILADHGYDVWLGNSRGNTYSRRHQTYDPNVDEEYWQWSYDELARFDVPACIKHVLEVTGKDNLTWIGHSQGAMVAFASLTDSEVEKHVNLLIGLAPVTRVGHTVADLRHLAPLATSLHAALYFFGFNGEILPNSSSLMTLSEPLCENLPAMCNNVAITITSQIAHNFNQTRIPVYFSHAPAGTSAQNIVHFAQSVVQRRFQRFDRGPWVNWEKYGRMTPPEYDISSIKIPVAVFWSEEDKLAGAVDTRWMLKQLRNLVLSRKVNGYGHMDFIWATDAHQLIYSEVIDLLRQHAS